MKVEGPLAMKTQIKKTNRGFIVTIEGRLDYETTDSFRENFLSRLASETAGHQVVFDLGELQFVGSSGITKFVQALREFNLRSATRPRYTNVRNEFKKIISAFDDENTFDFWDSNERALRSFDN
jgi:anti-anti-sigma factor